MPRGQKEDMQVNVAGLRRNIKNLAHNYSDAQIKVREATSNDPWGPSSTLMTEIADLTYNVMAFTEIMHMIWKRLNDHGKNWRHVYKALVLMEYLIKTGTEKVALQCKENIFAIHTLKDFQYLEDGKDQELVTDVSGIADQASGSQAEGLNVREKAKQLVNLLKDDERLKNERARALKAKERFAQSASAIGSDGALDTPSSPPFSTMGGGGGSSHGSEGAAWSGATASAASLETARPQTAGEEELQLQLALAVSREEAERDERRRRSDNVRLQLALSQSEQDFKGAPETSVRPRNDTPQQSHLLDLLDMNVGNPVSNSPALVDPWGAPPTPPQRPQSLDLGYEVYYDPMQLSSDPWSSSPVSPLTVGLHGPSQPHNPPLPQPPPDPWAPPTSQLPPPQHSVIKDPWAPTQASDLDLLDYSPPMATSPLQMLSSPSSDLEFDLITNRTRQQNGSSNNNNHHSNGGAMSPDPFDLSILGDMMAPNANPTLTAKKTPQSFLGENSALVNLDNLIKPMNGGSVNEPLLFGASTAGALNNSHMNMANPFSSEVPPPRQNLFQAQTQPRLTMNEIKQQPPFAMAPAPQDPWAPVPHSHSTTPNPFLS